MENKSVARIKETKKFLNELESFKLTSFKIKPVKNTKNSFEKRLVSYLKSHKDTTLLLQHKKKEELRRLMFSVEEIQDLPGSILRLPSFNSFEVCHVLVHEKGKPIAQNYFEKLYAQQEMKLIGVQNFNSLYSLIKKSKNKIFNLAEAFKDDLFVLGNFLAKEIELKNYSVIYLVSRNSFLPPNKEEQQEFQMLSQFIMPVLAKILDKDKNDFKTQVLKKSLESFPEKMLVRKNNQILFSNKDSSAEDSNLLIFPIDEDNTNLELSNFSKDQISTEFYHTQRISLLGELLNTLQHELSNPLFGLNLTSTLLESEAQSEETAELLKEISQNANRSQTIIKNFSNLYTTQENHKQLALFSFLEEVATLTKSETKEIKKTIIWKGFADEVEARQFQITTNSTYLTQIIFNLIINAAQAIKEYTQDTRKHSITIQFSALPECVKIEVVDDGPGINPQIAHAIFDAFYTTKNSGTGLGLSICQNLAQQLGSKIEFQNNSPLLGATFWINLPIR